MSHAMSISGKMKTTKQSGFDHASEYNDTTQPLSPKNVGAIMSRDVTPNNEHNNVTP